MVGALLPSFTGGGRGTPALIGKQRSGPTAVNLFQQAAPVLALVKIPAALPNSRPPLSTPSRRLVPAVGNITAALGVL